jgi:hypothetical protein
VKSIGRIGSVEIGRVLDATPLGQTMQDWFPDFNRDAVLEFCASENALLLPGYFQAPHVGRIKRAGGTFAIHFGW